MEYLLSVLVLVVIFLGMIIYKVTRSSNTDPKDNIKYHEYTIRVLYDSKFFCRQVSAYHNAGYETVGDYTLENGEYKVTMRKRLDPTVNTSKIIDELHDGNRRPETV